MPRLMLDKTLNEAADGLMRYVKNATREEQRDDQGQALIVVEGDFEFFSLAEMDMWGGHLRFTIYDTEAKDAEEIATRGNVAMWAPQLAPMMTAKAQMLVERRAVLTVTTIKSIGGRELSREVEERESWEDVTAEFHRIAQREHALGL